MSKAERRAKENQRSNALKMQKTNLWSHFSTKDDLTDYAERSTFQQWEKSIHCNCIALERNIFLVHTPTTHDFELCKISNAVSYVFISISLMYLCLSFHNRFRRKL